MESVEDNSGFICESVGLEDGHAPSGKHAGDGGKQRGPVGGEQRKLKRMTSGKQFGLNGFGAEFAIEAKVGGNFIWSMHGQIAAGETFQETLHVGLRRSAAGQTRDLFEELRFLRSMQTVPIEATAEEVRRSHEKLPEHFRFPWGQGFGIDGVNVRVG